VKAFTQKGFPYQAIVRDNTGAVIADRDIHVKFGIHQAAFDGAVVYEETHAVQTDEAGRIELEIGKGNNISGDFDAIDWQKGSYFVETQLDRGDGYFLTGTQELLSIPYAEYAEVTGGLQRRTADGKTWQLTIDNTGNMQVVPIPKGYARLVFQDEFSGTGFPDSTKWSYCDKNNGIPGGVHQFYTKDRIENMYLEDGALNLVCRNDSFIDNAGNMYPVTSGAIETRYKGDWKYCRIEVRAKIPYCSGTWPAIWMMPTDDSYGYWPMSGEIDIMEHLGNTPYSFYYTAHTAKYHNGSFDGTARGNHVVWSNAVSEWHVFALEWDENRIEWYCDGKLQYRIRNNEDSWRAWPFDHRFYLILNFAYGYGWGTDGGYDLSGLPLSFQIDYVRVFQ
jgi:beta-glucanase (GH16 family)